MCNNSIAFTMVLTITPPPRLKCLAHKVRKLRLQIIQDLQSSIILGQLGPNKNREREREREKEMNNSVDQ